MSSVWRKTLVYLGLVEEPDEHDELSDHWGRTAGAAERPDEPAVAGRSGEPRVSQDASSAYASNVRPLRSPEPGAAHVRQMPAGSSVRATVVEVGVFEDVEMVGGRYRTGQPVVLDLRHVDTPVARRVLDFVSGVTYALRGRMLSAGPRSFVLVPDGIELPLEELDRLRSLGYEVERTL